MRPFQKNKINTFISIIIIVVITALLFLCLGLVISTIPWVEYNILHKPLLLSEYRPKTTASLHRSNIQNARFGKIDIHNHITHNWTNWNSKGIDIIKIIDVMDKYKIEKIVDLTLNSRDWLDWSMKNLREKYPNRFLIFTHVKWKDIQKDNFYKNIVNQLEEDVKKRGAVGLKILLGLRLKIKDESGNLLRIDDPRLDPLWSKAGELGIPVVIDAANPDAFFEPLDRYNERYEELIKNRSWHRYGLGIPMKKEVLEQRNNMIAKHPKTIFIGAYIANNSEDLDSVAELLERFSNLYIDISASINELGRQPRKTRDFL